MQILDDWTGERVEIVNVGALFIAGDNPGDSGEAIAAADRPAKLATWKDSQASARRIQAMRVAGFYVETMPSGRGLYSCIAFRADTRERALILRRACIAAAQGFACTDPYNSRGA